MAASLFHKHIDNAADCAHVERLPLLINERLQARETLFFQVLVDLVRAFRARRTGTTRIFEGEGASIADRGEQRERRVEIRFALAGKADDEVGGERNVRPRGANL